MTWKPISATAIAAVALLAVFGPADAQTTTTATTIQTQLTIPPATQGSGSADVSPTPSDAGQTSGSVTTDTSGTPSALSISGGAQGSASPGSPGTADEESAKARGVERR